MSKKQERCKLSDLDAQIAQLKAQVEAATAARYRAEAAKEAAQRSKDEALATLSEQFGLDSMDAARGKLSELEATLELKVAEATAILDDQKL
jgi:hypothetical protein